MSAAPSPDGSPEPKSAAAADVRDRRSLLRLAAVGGLATLPLATGVSTTSAAAVPTPVAARYPAGYSPIWVPRARDRHLVERFSYGFSPGLLRTLRAGDAREWFSEQLSPRSVEDSFAAGLGDWYPRLRLSPETAWRSYKAGQFSSYDVADDFAAWTLMRRTYSERQLHEVMTEFWSNLLHVAIPNTKAWHLRVRYDATIRRHALGRFDRLLERAVLHPAMLCFLDNDISTAQKLNENLGRELLELHTMGREAGYTERDVLNSARILTGWRVDSLNTWKRYYDLDGHYRGRVRVMGFSAANEGRDGRRVARRYLRWLAHHPATARRLAHRLAVRFISDDPSDQVVTDLARVFRRSGTDIKTTLRYLVGHPEFKASRGGKVRTPNEDYIATCRALGVRALRPTTAHEDFPNLCVYQALTMGQRPFGWGRPDGFPDNGAAWSTVSRMLGSWTTHHVLAAQARPTQKIVYRDLESWLPRLPMRLDAVVDHISRRLLGRRAGAGLVAMALAAVDLPAAEIITPGHELVESRLPLLVAALLDSPEHMTR